MEQINHCRGFCGVLLLFSFLVVLCFPVANGYQNYTVGDTLGWYDNLLEPKVNYDKWVAGKNFSLGDFLIFNTDKNHTVIQTYNATDYKSCDLGDADDTVDWSAWAPEYSADKVSVAVPLLKARVTYFFSSNYDGEQCQHGQRFMINVTYGRGLPDSLKSPSEAPAPASPDEGGTPDMFVPSNFNNPKQAGDADGTGDVKSETGEAPARLMREGWRAHLVLGVMTVALVLG